MTIKFTINGVRVEAEKGDNVLDTARRYGVEIPSLCHHEAVTPYGACRVCLVEIDKGGRKKITTSCNYEVLEGIEVKTDTPEIRSHRATVLELILAEAPGSEAIRKLAAEYGVEKPRFTHVEGEGKKRDDCILCGLCARVCSEIVGVSALTFEGRGDNRGMGAPFQEGSADCIGCASCASVCPTNCIPIEDADGKRTIWGRTFEMVCCDDCGASLMTKEYRDYAVANRALSEEYYTTCGACKKSKLAAQFAKVGS